MGTSIGCGTCLYKKKLSHSCVIEKLDVVSVWLAWSSGMINPVVYSLRNNDFRRAVLKLIHCKRPRSASVIA